MAEIERRPGLVVLKISGRRAFEVFEHESGGHRIQHTPAHDKRGRTQTSSLTVAVLPEPSEVEFHLDPRDLEISACRGSGAGGQHRNKTDTAVQIKHTPSGVMVRCEAERSQLQNKETALALLRSRLWDAKRQEAESQRTEARRQQVGKGMRGDKRRSYYFQRDLVVDHVLGREWKLKAFLRGDWA